MATEPAIKPLNILLESCTNTNIYLAAILSSSHINNTKGLIRWFDHDSPQINKILSEQLFPALIESMAGSDAICIKDMTKRYQDGIKQLERSWANKIRQSLIDQAASVGPEQQVLNWAQQYQELNKLCSEEIIPMADRLLDSTAMANLKVYCKDLIKVSS